MEQSAEHAANRELVMRVSAGDMEAYEEIYRRYVDDATRVARTVANSSDEATDIVFEAFARLLVRLREDGGLPVDVDEYLRVAVRRLAINRHPDAQKREEEPPGADEPVDAEPGGLSRIRRAYEAIPDELQQMLWHAEVERKSQVVLARGLDMSTSVVATLILRAREGLRQAYSSMAMADNDRATCRELAPNLAIYVKGSAPDAMEREIHGHLDDCENCRHFRDDYTLLISGLRQSLYAALLRPADPEAVARAAGAKRTAPGASAAVVVPTTRPAPAVSNVPSDGADTATTDVNALIDAPVAPRTSAESLVGERASSAALSAPVVPVGAGDGDRGKPRLRSRAKAITVGVGAVAAATVVAAFAMANRSASDDPVADGLDDSAYGSSVISGGVDESGKLAGPVVKVSSEADDESENDGAANDGAATDDTIEEDTSSWPSATPTDDPTTPDGTAPPSKAPSDNGLSPAFSSDPQSVSAAPGDHVRFTVGVSGSPAPDIQWQKRASSGASWSNISGATSKTLVVSVTSESDGQQFRAVATNSAGSRYSAAATLTVAYAPSITAHPVDAETETGGSATFNAAATAKPDITAVKWQRNVGNGWTDMNISVPPEETSTITISEVSEDLDGSQYRAVFSNEHGTVTTSAATLTVSQPAGGGS